MSVVVGIDTSCYTTSVCALDFTERVQGDYRKVLEVKKNNRGLRQSEAVFQHMNNLPNLISQTLCGINTKDIVAIAAAVAPRTVEGSYMPVFTASKNIGSIISSALKVPLIEFSHQEGHIRAGIWSAGGPLCDEFLCVHLSGGTTEILKIKKENNNYNIDIIGATLDISAGQLIDRVGVKLGLSFPCGRELEELSQKGSDKFTIPSSAKEINMSFSGAETLVNNNLSKYSACDIAFGVQKCIAKTLGKSIGRAVEKYKLDNVLIVGGVAANSYIKGFLKDKLNCNLFFAQPQYSVDNSIGIALLGVDYAKANFIGK